MEGRGSGSAWASSSGPDASREKLRAVDVGMGRRARGDAGGRHTTHLRAFRGCRLRGWSGWMLVTPIVVSARVVMTVATVPVVAPITAGASRPRPRTVPVAMAPVVAVIPAAVVRPAVPSASDAVVAMVARPVAVAPVVAPVVATHRARRSGDRRRRTQKKRRFPRCERVGAVRRRDRATKVSSRVSYNRRRRGTGATNLRDVSALPRPTPASSQPPPGRAA